MTKLLPQIIKMTKKVPKASKMTTIFLKSLESPLKF